MKIPIPTTSLIFFLIFSTTTGHPSPPPSNDSDFIRTSCRTTLYPHLCFTSLSGYSSAVQQDPARLARVAINLTLSKAHTTANYIAKIPNSTNPTLSSALRDCNSLFEDAIDDILGSLRQMRRLSKSGEGLRFEISNVQTWMSAALTNEETCTDGFEEVAEEGGVKAEVCGRTEKVKMVTSNALALVNGFASTVKTP